MTESLQVWKATYFVLSIVFFGGAHIMYTMAFGFERANWLVGAVIAVCALIFWKFVTMRLTGVMVQAVLVYALLIGTMLWRAISRLETMSDLKNSWTKLSSSVGE